MDHQSLPFRQTKPVEFDINSKIHFNCRNGLPSYSDKWIANHHLFWPVVEMDHQAFSLEKKRTKIQAINRNEPLGKMNTC